MLAFSTCWNNSRHNEGEAVIEEILELGFDTVELSHGTTISKLPGFQRAYKDGMFRCCGVHNFFPSPTEVIIDAPDVYEFTSFRKYERERAMEMSLRTLDMAAEFEAEYVVLHMGSVPLMPHYKWTNKLVGMVKEGEMRSSKYIKHKIKCIKKREKHSSLYYGRAREALYKLAEKAKELNLKLGVESRSRYEDVPSEREMRILQKEFADNPNVGYWHDFGHVQLKENIELLDHEQWLKDMQPYMVGCHLHDVVWPHRDHRVPFTGSIDYKKLVGLFPPEAPFVWELSSSRRASQIVEALEVWKATYPETLCKAESLETAL